MCSLLTMGRFPRLSGRFRASRKTASRPESVRQAFRGGSARLPKNVVHASEPPHVVWSVGQTRRACHDQAEQTVPVSRSKRGSSGRTNAPCPVAGARRSLLPHHRSRTGKPTNHRQRTDRSSAGQTPHRLAAQVSLGGTATHDAAHGSHNHAFCRLLPPPTRQSRGRRNGTSRATHWRRDIEARQGSRRCDQRHRD